MTALLLAAFLATIKPVDFQPFAPLRPMFQVESIACVPDDAHYSPTPTIRWDAVFGNGGGWDHSELGYRIFYRVPPATSWTLAQDFKFQPIYDKPTDTIPLYWQIRSETDIPVQRWGDWQSVFVEWNVRAYNQVGEGPDSQVLRVCMSPLEVLR